MGSWASVIFEKFPAVERKMVRALVLVLGLWVGLITAQAQPRVTVEQGELVGTTETFEESEFIGVSKSVDVFRGIPFAEPPVGPLRFRPPVAKEPWTGTYDATYFRDACVQDPAVFRVLFNLRNESEDCLHLNIYAPSPKPDGAAVMVWIHGGGFVAGSAVQTDYNGIPLAAVGDVIVVTINYRLNVFGFLTTGDEASPGNAGLRDQVLALQWIKRNIGAFGGDGERITIFGESAGSASVGMHIVSPQTEGLFNQAILQSGTALSPFAFDEDKDRLRHQAFHLGEVLGCSAQDSYALVSCLRVVNSTALSTAALQVLFRSAVVADGTFLSDSPAKLYAAGRYQRVNLLLGTNADEGTLFVFLNPRAADYVTSQDSPLTSREIFDEVLSEEFTYYLGGPNNELADAVRMRYVNWSSADYDTADYFRAYVDYATDFYFACGTNRMARVHAQGGDNVFLYQMTHVPSVSYFSSGGVGPGWLGATHAEEIPFVFGFPFIPEVAALRDEITDQEKAMTVKFMEFWTNFAKNGNPGLRTPGSQPESDRDYWPRLTIPKLEYKVLSLNLTRDRALKADECYFWNTYVPQFTTMFADLGTVQREWRQSFVSWKYTDLPDWRAELAKYGRQ